MIAAVFLTVILSFSEWRSESCPRQEPKIVVRCDETGQCERHSDYGGLLHPVSCVRHVQWRELWSDWPKDGGYYMRTLEPHE